VRSTADRRLSEAGGRRSETLAAWWLRLKGYRILARRLKTPAGEVDLVVARGQSLVFVEVKARATLAAAAEALTPRQQGRIIQGARDFLTRNPRYGGHNIRFDLVLIAPGRLPRHIVQAFDASF
jgi:putative endonuclease